MMPWNTFLAYLAVMAGVTYLTRMVPLALFRRRIRNRFIKSFLCYVPYAVLTAMTLPGILYSTGSVASAAAGFAVAALLSWKEKSLLLVAVCAALTVAAVGVILGVNL